MSDLAPEANPPPAPPLKEQSGRGMAVLMVLGILGSNLVAGLPRLDIGGRQLVDTDGYMRFVRVLSLVTGENGWFDGWVHGANAPFGHSMHWTRPLDVILIGLGASFAPFIGWRDGIYAASIALGPLLHLAVGFAVAWTARPLVGPLWSYLAGLAVAVQSGLLLYAAPARPDHHVLILLAAVVLVGCVSRILVGQGGRVAAVAGVCSALGLWISTEFLLPLGIGLSGLAVFWVASGRGAKELLGMARWMAGGIALALLIERGPSGLSAIEYDRISLVHFGLALVIWASAIIVNRPRKNQTVGRRALILPSVGLVGGSMVWFAFPRFFAGPFVDVPPQLARYWLDRVRELSTLWDAANHRGTGVILLVGSAVLGIGFGIWVLWKSRNDKTKFAPWLFMVSCLAVMLAISWRNARFVIYSEALGAIPIAGWAALILRSGLTQSFGSSLRKTAAMVTVVVGFVVPLVIVQAFEKDPPGPIPVGTCDLEKAIAAIRSQLSAGVGNTPVVLSSIDSGPELLYRLPVMVVPDPYHRNVEGILDSAMIFGAKSDEIAEPILAKHQVRYVAVCSSDVEASVFTQSDQLFRRLLEGRAGLGYRELPVAAGSGYRLYQRTSDN